MHRPTSPVPRRCPEHAEEVPESHKIISRILLASALRLFNLHTRVTRPEAHHQHWSDAAARPTPADPTTPAEPMMHVRRHLSLGQPTSLGAY
jgi:hypothetical protein